MPVKENDTASEPKAEKFDPKAHDGFHVLDGSTYLGTYPTEADAQAFIDGHMTPQDKKGTIVEGHDPEPDA